MTDSCTIYRLRKKVFVFYEKYTAKPSLSILHINIFAQILSTSTIEIIDNKIIIDEVYDLNIKGTRTISFLVTSTEQKLFFSFGKFVTLYLDSKFLKLFL